ncbi:MAG: exo-alpha-sialidase [Planctomycetes bacterium]|nr:exo-alpha-sialidase [Planctomycetota bacterium]
MPARRIAIALATLLLIGDVRLTAIQPTAAAEGPTRNVLLPPGPGNPRNSEGDFIQLRGGRILFVYTRFTGGGGDHSAAHLAGRYSSDAGLTWTKEDATIVGNEGGWNVMSVSLLRLADRRIALFYLRKDSLNDCRPYLRISSDEAETWTDPKVCIDDEVAYYVLNNDRAVQLESGRLILPVALHNKADYEKPDWEGKITCYLSDDVGDSWRRSKSLLVGATPEGKRATLQEPGLIELDGGRLMMFCRTRSGSQYLSYSEDDGDTWSEFVPSSIISPCSPASIERIPKTGHLLLVWNNHQDVDDAHRGKRTPYNVALSRDEGRTWEKIKTLEDDPFGWYCYTAVDFLDDHVLLGHCAGIRKTTGGLATTQITRFSLDWLYK